MHKAGRTLLALGAAVTFGIGTAGTAMAATQSAVVTKDGESKTLYMLTSGDTNDILKTAGVTTSTGDLVLRSTSVEGKIKVDVRTAFPVTITADGQTKETTAHYGDTARQVLTAAGVTLGQVDIVNVPLDQPMPENTLLTVKRNHIVTVAADGVEYQVVQPVAVSAEETVRRAGVTLGSNDVVSTNTEKNSVTVSRVTYQETTTTEEIPFETVTKEDSSLTAGETSVQTAGINGQKQVVKRTKYINGKASETTVASETVTKAATNKVVLKGTKQKQTVASSTASSASSSTSSSSSASASTSSKKTTTANGLSYSRVITGKCTAYSGGGTTATGAPAAVGRVAVDPSEIPYGTRLYIASADGSYVYGYCVAADTGGFIYSSSTVVDLYMNTEAECESFGRRTMNIYILN